MTYSLIIEDDEQEHRLEFKSLDDAIAAFHAAIDRNEYFSVTLVWSLDELNEN
jgi:hypothetical protein